MRLAILSSIARRTPPRCFGPPERVVSLLTEGLVARGVDVTLFATADSQTSGKLHSVAPRPYQEDDSLDPKIWECLHLSELFELADRFDIIHNHAGYEPLSYSGLTNTPIITTIYGSPSRQTLPLYKKYDDRAYYVSISDRARAEGLTYIGTVYPGVEVDTLDFSESGGDYLVFPAGVESDNGAGEAVEIAKRSSLKLVILGAIRDREYFRSEIEPFLDSENVKYIDCVDANRRSELLGGAWAILCPSSCSDEAGVAVIEATACGAPVIAFEDSLPHIVDHGVNGFLVTDTSSAVKALERIGGISRADCRRIAFERFSADRMVERYLEIYSQVMQATRREESRPWGHYEVLADMDDHKVKRIVVLPGKRLSMQRHKKRAEQWTVVDGYPVVTLETEEFHLKPGDSIRIPTEALHRISNPGSAPVVFIEVQVGEYFGEDDIERLEDDYGRIGSYEDLD